MTGCHRGGTAPVHIRLWCWAFGHQPERLAPRTWRCTRCDRIAPTPVELP